MSIPESGDPRDGAPATPEINVVYTPEQSCFAKMLIYLSRQFGTPMVRGSTLIAGYGAGALGRLKANARLFIPHRYVFAARHMM